MNVLFVTSNRIGDAMLSTGVLAHLVDTMPQARFTVACGALAAPLFEALPRRARTIALVKARRCRSASGHGSSDSPRFISR